MNRELWLDKNNDMHVADLFQEVEPTSVEVTPLSTNQKPINGNQSANSNAVWATDNLTISAQVEQNDKPAETVVQSTGESQRVTPTRSTMKLRCRAPGWLADYHAGAVYIRSCTTEARP